MAQQADIQTKNSALETGKSVEQRTVLKRGTASQALYFVRRWPVIPLIVMAILLIAGIFAPVLAPADPISQSLAFRNYRGSPRYFRVSLQTELQVEYRS